ncbi:hypothetical protein LFL96_26140 [Paraburkholderia sp. D15]|uniref:hypothetical protein n=1 Tax=Paraburkholderia sp. D15 TaxID=2880218 RepID=UPI00247A6491|nr:hypothetical protein [Paraburkholderia sp. D15]WGS54492.1 hypothetical protein LFL96_26140 [Paraburkholderia sp. D15]
MKFTTARHRELLHSIATELRCSHSMALAVSFDYVANVPTQSRSFETKVFSDLAPVDRVHTYFDQSQHAQITDHLKKNGLSYTEFTKRVIEQMYERLPKLNYKHRSLQNFKRT